jgi:hypothetical protein
MLRTALVFLLLATLSVAQTKPASRAKPAQDKPASAEAAVKKLEQQWLDAVGKRAQAAVDALLAPDFRAIAIDGRTRERQQELATVVDTTRPLLGRFLGRLEVSVYGPGFAIARGLVVINGENIREAHIAFTHVWVLREGRWQAVASQETLENY